MVPAMLSVKETAETLGIKPSTVRHQIKNGKLAARKISRDWYLFEDEVERYRADSLKRGKVA